MIKHLLLTLALLLLTGCTSLAKQPVFEDAGYAVRGYDVVAYFTESKPVKGQQQYQSLYQGSVWLFATEHNRDLFELSPQQYAPQYGGYCTYAMSSGFVVSTDPQAFTIHQDKLYLNYSLSVRENWLENKIQFIEEADAHWKDKIAE
ncbi:YHS domain-containing (seleno)protein [Shewanella maritima]|uniref:YHS domain-containing (seleno)protein n=1 Tax=Shewanella maritima TaxID=2520507 RepID=UPI003736A49C